MSKWRSFEKRAIFDLLFTFIPSAHISLIDFFALPILKKIQIYQVRFLFSVIPGVDSYLRHFGTINK